MSKRDPNTGRFLVGGNPAPASPAEGGKEVAGLAFTGLDPFTASLVARAPRVEPAQPVVILPARTEPPAPPQPAKADPSPLLVGGLGAALGLGVAVLLGRGVSRG